MPETPSTMIPLGTRAPHFSLPDTDGNTVDLDDYKGAPALLVAFICNHCPYVQHVRSGFAQLARDAQDKGVAVVAISSNDVDEYPVDGPEAMKAERQDAGYTFAYLYDESQEVAKAYGAACTPDFFLFDAQQQLVYRGQMDASRPSNSIPVDGSDLRAAIDAVLNGEPVATDQRPSVGCNIKWKPGNNPD